MKADKKPGRTLFILPHNPTDEEIEEFVRALKGEFTDEEDKDSSKLKKVNGTRQSIFVRRKVRQVLDSSRG